MKTGSKIRLKSPAEKEHPAHLHQAVFKDTEFGNFFTLDKKLSVDDLNALPEEEKVWLTPANQRNRKLPAPVMKWMAGEIARYSKLRLELAGYKVL